MMNRAPLCPPKIDFFDDTDLGKDKCIYPTDLGPLIARYIKDRFHQYLGQSICAFLYMFPCQRSRLRPYRLTSRSSIQFRRHYSTLLILLYGPVPSSPRLVAPR